MGTIILFWPYPGRTFIFFRQCFRRSFIPGFFSVIFQFGCTALCLLCSLPVSIQLTEEGILLRKRAEDLVKMADKISTEFLAPDDTLGALYPLSSSKSSRTIAKTMLY